jgi:hypothetical protein
VTNQEFIMRHAIALVCLLFAPLAAHAVVTTNNLGNGSTQIIMTYTVATTNLVDIRDDTCRGLGWTATILCAQPQVTAGQCTAGQLGQQITNPQTCLQAIDAAVVAFVRAKRQAGVNIELEATIAADIATSHDGDIQP